jgi:hypothetical protein
MVERRLVKEIDKVWLKNVQPLLNDCHTIEELKDILCQLRFVDEDEDNKPIERPGLCGIHIAFAMDRLRQEGAIPSPDHSVVVLGDRKESSILFVGAFRYYLGKRSSANGNFCALLADKWKYLDEQTKDLILKELAETVYRDDEMRRDDRCSSVYYPLGNNDTRTEWLRLLKRIKNEIYFISY